MKGGDVIDESDAAMHNMRQHHQSLISLRKGLGDWIQGIAMTFKASEALSMHFRVPPCFTPGTPGKLDSTVNKMADFHAHLAGMFDNLVGEGVG